jgi:hypothetical protein
MQTFAGSDLDTSNTSASTSNFCYSIWFFIDDWNYRYGEPKVIFGRMSGGTGPCPLVVLGATENNIITTIQVYPGADSVSDTGDNSPIVHDCNVGNIPLQKWVNLIISAYGRSLDIYIDGKLSRTAVMPNVLSSISTNGDVYLSPGEPGATSQQVGFSGYTSNLKYYTTPLTPSEVWNLYRKGPGTSVLSGGSGGSGGDYSIQVSLYDGNIEKNSFTIGGDSSSTTTTS